MDELTIHREDTIVKSVKGKRGLNVADAVVVGATLNNPEDRGCPFGCAGWPGRHGELPLRMGLFQAPAPALPRQPVLQDGAPLLFGQAGDLVKAGL